MLSTAPSATFIRDLYARMLLTRLVDECAWKLHKQGRIDMIARACGHEAAQVGSAVCIERGMDFTLPYYRDLGVVLMIGMTPYEVFRTYLQAQQNGSQTAVRQRKDNSESQHTMHWGYHKYNTVTGPAPVATQILHAAGIAFASKLRKAPVVTVAYCGDGATCEADFREGVQFAALHQLPVVFVCEQDCALDDTATPSSIRDLPPDLTYKHIDGTDIVAVYTAMSEAMQHARKGRGPVLLEMRVSRSLANTVRLCVLEDSKDCERAEQAKVNSRDPLVCCKRILEQQGNWDDAWAEQLYGRLKEEVEQAVQDALRDTNASTISEFE
jgi:2-oxoisovalerate dehydrogenase E1 component alpha subunit